jgi:dTDP-L-rhamnose 4-epimerase
MVTKKILVTGGAGFIGSHLVDDLIAKGHEVYVYDSLEPQVHGNTNQPPTYLSSKAKFIQNDVRNMEKLYTTLQDIQVVYHLAAAVGVGQSMYQIDKYMDINSGGTSKLLDIIVNKPNKVEKVIVASSNTIYGEGRYRCPECGVVNPPLRENEQMEKGEWELKCPTCKQILTPIPTDELKPSQCTSIYAYTKKMQEDIVLLIGKTYGINTTALRFFCVYGSRQSLSNPYTGVCAIFSTNLLCGNAPTIYEDGQQTRDFVHVKDINQGLVLAMERPEAKHEVFNVGTGTAVNVTQVAQTLAKIINPKIQPIITKKYRKGDIRHCYADITKISTKLGYKPKYTFETGIKEVADWVRLQTLKKDESDKANEELKKKGLI